MWLLALAQFGDFRERNGVTAKAIIGDLFTMVDDPTIVGPKQAYRYIPGGMMVVENGIITAIGPQADVQPTLVPGTEVRDHSGQLITPGFIDTHIHFPQIDMIASYGEQLLDWLENYTFPAEAQYSDPAHAADAAEFFISELLRNGTTSALVYGSVHAQSVDALFEAAHTRNMRLVAGKSLMDRNVPDAVRDTAESGDSDSRMLADKWHGKGRLGYAVTPRFAPACSDEQLMRAGKMLQEYDGLLMHTHMSENTAEIAWVAELYPEAKDYLDVYDSFGLLTDHSVFAHCIHLGGDEFQRMSEANAAIAYCPTSNLFLGSGLFHLKEAEKYGVKVGIGSDVGAGTSFSILTTMAEAYKVGQLRGHKLDPMKSFYLATLGGANALNMGDRVGSLEVGKEADFLVYNMTATPLLARRLKHCKSIEETLFVLSILGDDRVVAETCIAGEKAYFQQPD